MRGRRLKASLEKDVLWFCRTVLYLSVIYLLAAYLNNAYAIVLFRINDWNRGIFAWPYITYRVSLIWRDETNTLLSLPKKVIARPQAICLLVKSRLISRAFNLLRRIIEHSRNFYNLVKFVIVKKLKKLNQMKL